MLGPRRVLRTDVTGSEATSETGTDRLLQVFHRKAHDKNDTLLIGVTQVQMQEERTICGKRL